MDLRFTAEEEAFRAEIRDFFKRELPPGWRGASQAYPDFQERLAFTKAFLKKMGKQGWLQMNWPKEYGGRGASAMMIAILGEEGARFRAPYQPEAGWIGPTIIMHGTDEQKKRYLPGIAAGDTELCVGYSEPSAGSDLFSLKTRADEDGDSYVINGQKIFTSLAHYADYCWLAVRTDQAAPKHKGISVFMVDMKTPGITVRPLIDMAGRHTLNEVFWDNVRTPKDTLIGKKNGGVALLVTALKFERSWGGGAETAARCKLLLDELVQYTKETKRDGRLLCEDPIIRQSLAERATEIEIVRLLAYRLAWQLTKPAGVVHEASINKIFGSEMEWRLADTGSKILGPECRLERSKWTPLANEMWLLRTMALTWIIGGGTNEIQRNIIAGRGLGLPVD